MAKTLTELQKKKKYNRISKMTYLFQYLSMAAPYIVIGIYNYDEYFVQYDGTRVSLAFIMAMVVFGLTIYGTTKEKFKNNCWILMIKLLIFAYVFFLMGQLIQDLGTICLFGAVGLAGSGTLNTVSQNYKAKAQLIKECAEEVNKENIKAKIKKEESEINIGAIL